MPHELRFSTGMLSKVDAGDKPVRPTLHLSRAALETPLPDGPLSSVRCFLTRTGPWKGHPLDSVEAFLAIPAPGVSTQDPLPAVIGFDEPVFTSVGFGMKSVGDGVVRYATGVCEAQNIATHCDTYLCVTHATVSGLTQKSSAAGTDIETCYWSHCKTNSCGIHSCSSQRCDDQHCTMLDCSTHSCSEQVSLSMGAQLDAHWTHPFVQELGRYFGIDVKEDLAKAIMHYVGRNMFDESAQ